MIKSEVNIQKPEIDWTKDKVRIGKLVLQCCDYKPDSNDLFSATVIDGREERIGEFSTAWSKSASEIFEDHKIDWNNDIVISKSEKIVLQCTGGMYDGTFDATLIHGEIDDDEYRYGSFRKEMFKKFKGQIFLTVS